MSDLSFYEAAAQVIPLLVLAMAFETRFFDNLRPFDAGRTGRGLLRLDAALLPVGVVLMVAGELAALHVLLTGDPTGIEQRLTVLGLLVGVFGIATPALNGIMLATTKSLERFGESDVRFAQAVGGRTIQAVHVALIVIGLLALAGWVD